MGADLSPRVSPVKVSFNLATAPISPACNSVTGTAVFPCMMEMCASFSCVLRVKFCSDVSFFNTPEKTLKYEMRPAKGSDTVLNTYSDTGSESASLRCGGSPLPEVTSPRMASCSDAAGVNSTMKSIRRSVLMLPRPEANRTGKILSSRMASCKAGIRCSSGIVPLSKNSSISASLPSAIISTSFSWAA